MKVKALILLSCDAMLAQYML